MRVVLLKDIPGVGRKNEVKSVADGYALNLLIPKKLAIAGTPTAIAHAERLKSEHEAERRVQEDLLCKNLSSMEGVVIEMFGKTNEQGHLFASIHREAIAIELKRQKGIDLPPEFFQLEKPIKKVGEYVIPVKAQGKTEEFTLIVKPSE